MQDELRYLIALSWLFRWRLRTLRMLLDQFGSATEVWHHVAEEGMNEALQRADKEIAFILKHDIHTYYYKDEQYPRRLRECPDAPVLLYGKGALELNKGRVISIVGTRMATERGKERTRQLVLDLKEMVPDITVVSGLAYGIDVAAHRAALEANLPTLIVPAHGLDRIYPPLHRDVAVQALERGGILTEYPSETEPERFNFVARNRIIAGLADAVVIVESKIKGGSLITAGMACDYNREVFAFPGRVEDEGSAGCNNLIRDQKAMLIQNAQDLVQAMGWEMTGTLPFPKETAASFVPSDPTQQSVLAKLREAEDGIHVNSLVMETQLGYSDVITALMMLELEGVVKGLPGGMYRALK